MNATYTTIWLAPTEPNTKENSDHNVLMAGSFATLKRLALVCGLDVVEHKYYSEAFQKWHTQWGLMRQDGKQSGFIKSWRSDQWVMLFYHEDLNISGDEFAALVNNTQ